MLLRGINRFYKALSNGYIFGVVLFFLLGLSYFILYGLPVRVPKITYNNIAKDFQPVVSSDVIEQILPQKVTRDEVLTLNPLPLIVKTDDTFKENHQIMKVSSYHSWEDADDIVRNRFLSRNKQIKKTCSKFNGNTENSSNHYQRREIFAHGRLKWCRVLKVGSSFISQLKEQVSREVDDIPPGVSRIKTFMAVREPYSRLVSGYIDRILTFPPSWDRFGTKIIETFRPKATTQEIRCGRDVTFPEFIKFFIRGQETGWMKNSHFAPMSEPCNPCKVPFDFICHLETIKEDFSFILRSSNITPHFDLGISPGIFKGKVTRLLLLKETVTRCQTMCGAFRTLWWAFKSRGLLPRSLPFPLSEADCEKNLTENVFGDLCWDTYQQNVGKFDKYGEIRKTIVELFLQVSLEDRIKVRDLLATDFELFGYEAQPDDIFPELVKDKSSSDLPR